MHREERLFTEGHAEMRRKAVSGIMLALLFISVLTLAFNVQLVKSDWTWTETIYVGADGSVDPDTAPISSVDNITYTLTDNIVGDVPPTSIAIVVERDDIIIDGAGYTLQGTGAIWSKGINLTGRTNVTVQNTQIKNFDYGIWLSGSSNNSIRGNNITHNGYGIWLSFSNSNVVSGNTFTNDGLDVWYSYMNVVEDNTVNGKPLVYLEGVSDYTVGDAGQVILVNCKSIKVENLNLSRTSIGVLLWQTNNSGIADNKITNNRDGVLLRSSSNNSISENNITANSDIGISIVYCAYSPICDYNTISGNHITDNGNGIWLSNSSSNTVSGNNIEGNNYTGILLTYRSNNNSICENNLTDNGDSISLWLRSNYNSVSGNTITANSDSGIYVHYSDYNTMSENHLTDNGDGIFLENSSNTTISGNTITNNDVGIKLDESRAYAHNRIYHNNFIVNTQQLNMVAPSRPNFWDDGLEGNYWSNYTGVDSNHDGIGDSWHETGENNTDRYPLMGPFHSFNTSVGEYVSVVSNSTVTYFNYEEPKGWIIIQVRNATPEKAFGFCRVCIPHNLIDPDVTWIHVVINDGTVTPLHFNNTLYDNGTHRWIYVAYPHSLVEIVIVPEFPSFLVLPIFIIATLLAVTTYKRKHSV